MDSVVPQPLPGGVDKDGQDAATANMRQSLTLQAYEAERARLTDSFFAKIAMNNSFQNATLVVIVLNAIWIFIDVEWNHSSLKDANGRLPLAPASDVVENLFCTYFTAEVLIRFLAFRKCIYCFQDAWFVFDCTLVLMMVLETWAIPIISLASGEANTDSGVLANLSSFRLLRLLRLTRIARIMRFFPELMTLVKGMVRAMQSVVFILLFLVVVMFVFAIVFTNFLGEPGYAPPADAEDPTAKQMFSDLGSSMMSLFTHGVLGDNLYITLEAIRQENLALMWAFMVFMVMSGMTLLNMLIGVLCQVIDDSKREEEEGRQLSDLRTCLIDAFNATDESNDGLICEEEWAGIRSNRKVQASLLKLGVEESMMEERLNQMQDSLFGRRPVKEGDEATEDERKAVGLSFDEFVEQVIDLRMDTPASALDVEMLKSTVRSQDRLLKRKLDRMEAELSRILGMDMTTQELSTERSVSKPIEKPSMKVQQDTGAEVMTLPGQMMDGEANATATSTGSIAEDSWLHEVPLELLFHVLTARSRAEAPLPF
eukprot:TRINITY_DN40511_c0_g1_i1.p1 TRINITY_DN40511_c0_g1~~TRINITY_DN40511_c0_g1_i1.p1  ORF type:complete len:541 (-),score=137.52 TRINITY_DN40511_c0_g1_i1:82-1704(-)